MVDLVFDILARDRASRVLKNVGDSADSLSSKLQKLDGLKGGILATGLPGLAGITGIALSSASALGAVAVMGTTARLALSGVGDAFSASGEDAEKYQEALDELSPSAAATVVELTGLKSAWGEVGDAVQEAAFRPVVGDLTTLSENVIPALSADLPKVAQAMGEAAESGMQWAGSADTIADVRTIIQGTVPIVDDFGASLVNAADFMTQLGAAGMPVGQEIAEQFREMTQGLRDWVTAGRESGELDATFAATSETVDLLFQNVNNLGGAIGTLAANPATIGALNDMLEVLTSITGVVGTAAEAFTSLPEGVQKFVLIAGAAAIAGSKLHAMYEGITSRARTAATETDRVSGSTSKFAGAANTMAVAGGRVVAVLGGMQIASALYSATQSETGISTGQLEQSLLQYGRTGEMTGEMMDVFKGKTDLLNDSFRSLDKDGLAGFGNGLATVIETVTGTGSVFDSSMENHKKRLGELDTALAAMVQSGNAEGARQIIDQLGEQAKEFGVDSEELNAALPQVNALLGDLAASADQTSAAQQRLSAQQKLLNSDFEQGVAAVGGLKNAFALLNADAQNTNSTFAAYQAALDNLTTSNINAKAGFDLTTAAGRQNYQMLQEAVVAMQNYATQANLTGPEIEALRQNIINQGTAAGISRSEMEAMTASIGAIPGQAQPAATSVGQLQSQIEALKSKQVEVKESGSADSKSRVQSLQAQINALQDRIVYVTTITRQRTEVVGSDGLNRRYGGGYRWGGVQMYAAQSGLVAKIARPGTIYQWAEPATGGEAFIPRKGNMTRNRDIARFVVDEWLGGPEAVWGQKNTSTGGMGSPAGGGGGSSSVDYGGILVREIRELGRRIESIGINIDGQALGRAQGRRTLLEQYGG